jgi:hypothetical protein
MHVVRKRRQHKESSFKKKEVRHYLCKTCPLFFDGSFLIKYLVGGVFTKISLKKVQSGFSKTVKIS